jgi:hypothetical protein
MAGSSLQGHVLERFVGRPPSTSRSLSMKSSAHRIARALLLGIAISIPPSAVVAQAADLHGGWTITGWENPNGEAPATSRGLLVFSESGHYSMMFVIGDARAALPESPSDADFAAAYGPFVANSGRYSVSGNTITYEAFVAKDPAYMAGFAPTGGEGNEQTMTFSISDGILTLGFGEGGPMGGLTATLRRPGGGD